MDISAIGTTKSVGKTTKARALNQMAEIKDRLSISSEAEKKGMWVEMVKEMPDVRPEKIAAALSSNPSSLDVAKALLPVDYP